MKCLKCQKPFATGRDQLCFDCKYPDPHEWWAQRVAEIAVMMKNTGVGELVIRRKQDDKYTFEVSPESDPVPKLPPHGQPYEKGRFETVGVKP